MVVVGVMVMVTVMVVVVVVAIAIVPYSELPLDQPLKKKKFSFPKHPRHSLRSSHLSPILIPRPLLLMT